MSIFKRILGKKTTGAVEDAGTGAGGGSVGAAAVQIDSKRYQVADLSLRGFRIAGYDGGLIARQKFDFRLFLPLDGEGEIEFPGYGVVQKISDQGFLEAMMAAPQPYFQRKLMQYVSAFQGQAGGRRRA